MFRASPLLFFTLAISFTVTHYLALQFHLYWLISWFDIMMHLWGGFLVVCALGMLEELGNNRFRSTPLVITGVLLLAMVSWELLEYSLGLTGTQPDFVFDTAMDLGCGTVGGLVGYVLLKNNRALV